MVAVLSIVLVGLGKKVECSFFFVKSEILNTIAHLGLRSTYKTCTEKFAMIFH